LSSWQADGLNVLMMASLGVILSAA